MSGSNNNKKKRGPESRAYERLIGESVAVVLSRDGSHLMARLIWVDRYTVGLRMNGRELVMNKRSIESLERDMGKPTNERRPGASR